jgi:hypothetical protein
VVAVLLASLHAQTPPARAQIGPLQAWVERSESGACQLRLRNAGDTTVLAWTVTVSSEDARYVSLFRHDGWRDEFHLPSARLDVPPGETRHFTVNEDGASGDLTVRVHFLASSSGVAHGMSEPAAHVGDAVAELAFLQARRRRQAAEAEDVLARLDAAIVEKGVATVLASALASSLLENEGDWNWWRVTQALLAAEALPAGDPKASAHLSAALDLLREARRRGNEPLTLTAAEPMAPLVVGRCAQ